MGGILHVITFEYPDDKKAMLDRKWLDRWFSDLRNVNCTVASLWKETWISVYGVPLAGWGYEIFYDIGCVFGRVISVNYSNFDCAKILVITDCLFTINYKLLINIDGKPFKVSISEHRKLVIPDPSPITQNNDPHPSISPVSPFSSAAFNNGESEHSVQR